MSTTEIYIAAAALMRADGKTLVVRKKGTAAFMQPGGKIADGETPVEALCRELQEELELEIKPAEARYVGRFSAPAQFEAGFTVVAELFLVQTEQVLLPMAEIEALEWISPDHPGDITLAALTREHILPWLCRNRPAST